MSALLHDREEVQGVRRSSRLASRSEVRDAREKVCGRFDLMINIDKFAMTLGFISTSSSAACQQYSLFRSDAWNK